MRPLFAAALILTVVFGGGYFYYTASAVCDVPISYQIGAVDERFGLSRDEVRSVVSEAESLWEDATGRNLFTYEPGGELTVQFLYDDRQQRTDAERNWRDALDDQREMTESVQNEYESLIARYDDLKAAYDARSAAYQRELAAHNAEVERWNEEGGAPEEVYESLNARQDALSSEQEALNQMARDLNSLVAEINALGDEGNVLVENYNTTAERYNERFSEHREFTQGDYSENTVSIYQFVDRDELLLVLAHELGHALSLGHVDDPDAIMYYFMEGQDVHEGLTEADTSEFEAVCGDGSLTLWSIL